MSYRDRRLARAERLRDWADKRETKSAAAFRTAKTIADGIPLGQPILVGHHSERHARRDQDRIHNGMAKGIEHERMANSMNSRADEIERQADHAIYNDDDDAIDKLIGKIASLEAERSRMKSENAAYRKGDEGYAAFCGITIEQAAARRVTIDAGYSWCRQPYPSYSLQNLGGNISRYRKRLQYLSGSKTTAAQATDCATATARAGLTITASMTTPSRAGKQPRPVWNVTGNLAEWRPLLMHLGGSWYRRSFSFWEDPTEDIETCCLNAESRQRET